MNIDKLLILSKIKLHYNLSSDAELARFLGIPSTTLSSWKARNSIDYDLVFSKCVDMDKNYLIGEEPLKGSEVSEPIVEYLRRTDKKVDRQIIPLYNVEAAAGLTKLFSGHQNIIDYLSIPNLPKCDGALYITGDSMYPLLKSGDIAAYKVIYDIPNGIFWGEMYVLSVRVDDDDFTLTKFVKKSELGEEYILLVSQNPHHAPKDVLIKNVTAIARIQASVRYNSMS